jgi:glycosyltransferase involved in cell wall biosynthesis
MKPKVMYWNNIPSPYFVERMNVIAERGNVHLTCVFNAERTPDRSWTVNEEDWAFEGHYAPAARVRGRTLSDPLPIVRSAQPDVLVSLYGEPSFAILGPLAARHARRWIIRVVPTYDAWETRTKSKEVIKRALGRLVDGAKVPGPDGANYAMSLGIPAQRLFPVQQTVPVSHFAAGRDAELRAKVRAEQGIGDDEVVFLYIGRLWAGKGLDYLVQALREMPGGPKWRLSLAGDGPMEAELRTNVDLPVHFRGFVQRHLLVEEMAAADCLVFPTLGDPFGLVVEEAFAAGLPVLASTACGDAVSRIQETGGGLLMPPRDVSSWSYALSSMRDDATRAGFARRAAERAKECDHVRYAEDFERMVEGALALEARWPALRRRT